MKIQMYVKTDSNNIVILNGTKSETVSLPDKRNKDKKRYSIDFVSYKTMLKEKKKYKEVELLDHFNLIQFQSFDL